MTWMDVASDAVKIGFGSVVGAGLGIYGTLLAANREWKRERSRRRLETLEKIAADFEAAHNAINDLVRDLVVPEGRNGLDIDWGKVREAAARMRQLLGWAEGRLLLMKMDRCVVKLAAYRKALIAVTIQSLPDREDDVRKKAHGEWEEARENVFAELAGEFAHD